MKLEDLTFQPEVSGPGYVIRWKEDGNPRAQTVPYVVGQILEVVTQAVVDMHKPKKEKPV